MNMATAVKRAVNQSTSKFGGSQLAIAVRRCVVANPPRHFGASSNGILLRPAPTVGGAGGMPFRAIEKGLNKGIWGGRGGGGIIQAGVKGFVRTRRDASVPEGWISSSRRRLDAGHFGCGESRHLAATPATRRKEYRKRL